MDFVAELLNEGKFEDDDEIEILKIMLKGYLLNVII